MSKLNERLIELRENFRKEPCLTIHEILSDMTDKFEDGEALKWIMKELSTVKIRPFSLRNLINNDVPFGETLKIFSALQEIMLLGRLGLDEVAFEDQKEDDGSIVYRNLWQEMHNKFQQPLRSV